MKKIIEWMKRGWRGEEKLWKVFWYPLVSVIAFASVVALSPYVYWIVAKNLGWNNSSDDLFTLTGEGFKPAAVWWITLLSSSFFIISVVINIWMNIAIWRCAFNSSLKLWAYLARFWVVLGWLGLISSFLNLYFGLSVIFGGKNALFRQTCTINIVTAALQDNFINNDHEMANYIRENRSDINDCVQNLQNKNQ